ncbi:SprT-like domain-containing protein [Cellulophaga baltica]|uniref:SprT-like domain-containing protein n=1 Tax=Cellulophaga TaxID=104264 RepID=UPI001C07C199|nr:MULTISPECIES: SprT-like domain-containing protein [Cellulophaga]MBU2997168.1 SprT-like domain-containing protein [Cellulophaga baltica]MDO6768566.1 SprT-like domain-containing protein [Cellulophaga sp. 1_MG-2023]
MRRTLEKYLPERAVDLCIGLIKENSVNLKIVNQRVTRHGDYRRLPDGTHKITVNSSLNKYRFLITLVHEIAHLVAFEKYGRTIKPHGLEWKKTFQVLMLPLIHPEVFPSKVLPLVANHFRNPSASSDTDAKLSLALKQYDATYKDSTHVFELPIGSIFRINNGRIFQKGNRKIKRYECVEVNSGKTYLFQPNAEVELIKN